MTTITTTDLTGHDALAGARIQSETCYWINCSDCGDECWEDLGAAPHFTSETELVDTLVEAWDWTFTTHGRPLCERCTDKANCGRATGHQYTHWGSDELHPGVLSRWCNRCSHREDTSADLAPSTPVTFGWPTYGVDDATNGKDLPCTL